MPEENIKMEHVSSLAAFETGVNGVDAVYLELEDLQAGHGEAGGKVGAKEVRVQSASIEKVGPEKPYGVNLTFSDKVLGDEDDFTYVVGIGTLLKNFVAEKKLKASKVTVKAVDSAKEVLAKLEISGDKIIARDVSFTFGGNQFSATAQIRGKEATLTDGKGNIAKFNSQESNEANGR